MPSNSERFTFRPSVVNHGGLLLAMSGVNVRVMSTPKKSAAAPANCAANITMEVIGDGVPVNTP